MSMRLCDIHAECSETTFMLEGKLEQPNNETNIEDIQVLTKEADVCTCV